MASRICKQPQQNQRFAAVPCPYPIETKRLPCRDRNQGGGVSKPRKTPVNTGKTRSAATGTPSSGPLTRFRGSAEQRGCSPTALRIPPPSTRSARRTGWEASCRSPEPPPVAADRWLQERSSRDRRTNRQNCGGEWDETCGREQSGRATARSRSPFGPVSTHPILAAW